LRYLQHWDKITSKFKKLPYSKEEIMKCSDHGLELSDCMAMIGGFGFGGFALLQVLREAAGYRSALIASAVVTLILLVSLHLACKELIIFHGQSAKVFFVLGVFGSSCMTLHIAKYALGEPWTLMQFQLAFFSSVGVVLTALALEFAMWCVSEFKVWVASH